MKSPWKFKNCGQSGLPISDLFPNIRECADDLCVVRSMVGEGVDHGAALLQTFTGTFTFTRPSMGSWVLYGLGSQNRNLPGYITIKPALAHGGAKNWASGFLPGSVQGTAIGNAGMQVSEIQKEPIEYLVNQGLNREQQRYELDMIQAINRKHQELWKQDDELETRIQSFEMAFRMQAEASQCLRCLGRNGGDAKSSTAWTIRRPPISAGSVCSLVAWRKPMFVSSNARTATNGISTPICSKSTTRTQARWISRSPACCRISRPAAC